MWHANTNPPRIFYATKNVTDGTKDDWGPTLRLLPVGTGQITPMIRQRVNFPTYQGTDTHNPAGLIDMIYVEDFANLRYYSTGAPVETPAPTKPLDHTYTNISDRMPQLEWRKVAADDGTNVTYDVQISATPLFDTIVVQTPAAPTPIVCPTSMGGVKAALWKSTTALTEGSYYYWRARARNCYGAGPWSNIMELGIDTTAPGAFDLTAPADNSDPGTKTPTFTWQAAPN
jgi:hypothetical protein